MLTTHIPELAVGTRGRVRLPSGSPERLAYLIYWHECPGIAPLCRVSKALLVVRPWPGLGKLAGDWNRMTVSHMHVTVGFVLRRPGGRGCYQQYKISLFG